METMTKSILLVGVGGQGTILGATIQMMNLDNIDWDAIISEQVKPAFVKINQDALARGRNLVSSFRMEG